MFFSTKKKKIKAKDITLQRKAPSLAHGSCAISFLLLIDSPFRLISLPNMEGYHFLHFLYYKLQHNHYALQDSRQLDSYSWSLNSHFLLYSKSTMCLWFQAHPYFKKHTHIKSCMVRNAILFLKERRQTSCSNLREICYCFSRLQAGSQRCGCGR